MDYKFTNTEFLSAKEKELVLRAWERFLKNGLQKKDFTKRLYEHLHLHCGFIAHYDINGFYGEYFQSPADTDRFFNWLFDNPYPPITDYQDLFLAMKKAYQIYEAGIKENISEETAYRIKLLKKCVKRAEDDKEFAKELLTRLDF